MSSIAQLQDELARWSAPTHPGITACGRRDGAPILVDAALIAVYRTATSTGERAPRTALVALGGYGRGALCPHSDIDLLLLHDGTDATAVAALADQLLYPLWDAGFTVGHAVRTPDETARLAADRLDAATSTLDARSLAGDEALLASAKDPVLARLREDPEGFVERLASDARDRRKRFGSAAYLLEPELKEGGGGLRDINALALAADDPREGPRGRRPPASGRARSAGCGGGVPDPSAERAPPGERPAHGQAASATSRTTSRS